MITKENMEFNANGEVVIPRNGYEIIAKPVHPVFFRDAPKEKENEEDVPGEAMRKRITKELDEGRDKLKLKIVERDKKEISLSALRDILLSMDTKDFYEGKKGSPTRGLYEKQRLSDIRSQRKFENGNWGQRFLREKASREERLTTALFDAKEENESKKLVLRIENQLRRLKENRLITENYYKSMLIYARDIKDQVNTKVLREIFEDILEYELKTRNVKKLNKNLNEKKEELIKEEEERKKKIELYIKNWERLEKERGWKT